LDAGLAEAEPCNQPAHVAIRLSARLESVSHPAADQTEVAGVPRNLHIRKSSNEAVHDADEAVPPSRVSASDGSNAVDDIEPFLPLGEKGWYDVGRVLQVRVQHDDRIAAREFVARGYRSLDPEVPTESDVLPPWVSSADFLY
jgi:hypothetical protein